MTSRDAPKLRRARLADVEALLDLMAAFNRSERIPFRRARVVPGLRRLLRERRLGVVVVAESADRRRPGRLDGYAVGTFGYDLEFAGPDAFLTELYVRPERRRRRLGARLLDAVNGALRDGGAAAVTLLVWRENQAARRLYAQAGFAEVPRVAMIRRLRAPRARGAARSRR
jgi:ribosomal protein S18 acetylase RimI-like enzyme